MARAKLNGIGGIGRPIPPIPFIGRPIPPIPFIGRPIPPIPSTDPSDPIQYQRNKRGARLAIKS